MPCDERAMSRFSRWPRKALSIAFLLVAGGCAQEQPPPAPYPNLIHFPPFCTLMVFFGEDSAELSPRMMSNLNTYSSGCSGLGKTLVIVGHTDAAGSAQGNLALSRVRAEEVQRYLQSTGFSAGKIVLIAKGDTQPLARVKGPEPQNRRVEIVIDWRS